ncbi:MAG: hypothetical protein M3Z04_25455 [Chloroflexota bacterium]|nr:hypothetical protein [Chloroflexota bacterium]
MYQHLVDFGEFTGQRLLSVLTMANVAGGVGGGALAWFLSAHLPVPGWLLWPLLMTVGVALTWPHESIPLGRLILLWCSFQLRRRLAPTTLLVHSRRYAQQPTGGPRILLGGAVSYQGSHLPEGDDSFPAWTAPPAYTLPPPPAAAHALPGPPALESLAP